MATGFASALSEGQPAQLDLGEEAVPCLVVGFTGADVVLAPGGELPEDALGPGNVSFLLIEAGGTLHALKAHVRDGYSDGELVATLLDPFRLGSAACSAARRSSCPRTCARSAPRTRRPPPSRATSAPAGLRVARQSTYQPADAHEVVLGLVQANREIKATAETVRATDKDVSLRFVEISPEDRLILAQLTFAYHRRSAA